MGFPALGISGAALATVIARILECLIMITILYKDKYVVAAMNISKTIQNLSFLPSLVWQALLLLWWGML
ncbi:hypothetical protein SAMN02745207_01425 [Clostridium grantii DSM 8605]|uniref:Uncharacterized protein n=2 Tax=Clostridium TaxID=1485 RepID=A0A1M5TPU5_9CLOT|nr:hypothetical protein SAMN02745207_01425 [Clostridium grantii DSM 8605]